MKPLKKSERKRFDDVCSKVREHLHMEHWQNDYMFTKKNDNVYATQHTQDNNNRIVIEIHLPFWGRTFSEQLWTLIHEHIHCILQEYDLLLEHVKKENSAVGRYHLEKMRSLAAEHTTDHLTTVLFDLLHHKFQ